MTIYNQFDPADNYVSVDYHADRILQTREMNEEQAIARHELRKLADSMYADGDIIGTGARCAMDKATGRATLEAGRIYIAGRMHDVAGAVLTVPVLGVQHVGIFLHTRSITAVEDPRLYNPAIEGEGHNLPGADRTKITAAWGTSDSGMPGAFFPVWAIEDGLVKPRSALNTNNPIMQALKDYDVASTGGGNYVVEGMLVHMQPDNAQGAQVYTVKAGQAHVTGENVDMPVDRSVVYPAEPNTQQILSEPHAASGEALQTILFDRAPVLKPATIKIQRKKTDTITRGSIPNGADPLSENSVVKINSVKVGATTYVQGTDYKLTAGQVDWSPGGAEPATGNTCTVEFEYIATEPVLNQTPTSFQIANGIAGTVHYVDYEFALRRFDRICMNAKGEFSIVKGVPATWQPVPPDVPPGLLLLATVYQSWIAATRRVEPDGWRMVPMQTIANYGSRMDKIETDQAELRLSTDMSGRFQGLKKGQFADPMLNDSMRDQGLPQTALIANGALQLNEVFTATLLDDGKTNYAMDFDIAVGIRQNAYSRSMAINPSTAAGQLPATVTLAPPIDRWEVPGVRSYPRGVEFLYAPFWIKGQTVENSVQAEFDKNLDKSLIDTSDIYLREIDVAVSVAGFDPLEPVKLATFDGKAVAFKNAQGAAAKADANGVVQGTFKVPAGVTVGTKQFRIEGENGSFGNANYTGSANIKLQVSYLYRASFGVTTGYQEVNYVV